MKKFLILSLFFWGFSPYLLAEHWEVSVSLKNGSTLNGYVLENLFMEEFVDDFWVVSQNPKTAGLRLWFVANTQGFIFLQYRHILHVEKVSSISDNELYTLRQQFEQPPSNNNPEKEAPSTPVEISPPKPPFEETPETTEIPAISPEQILAYWRILEQYPPALWNLQYARNQIRIQAMNGIPVSLKYRDFLEKYDDWADAQEILNQGQLLRYSVSECEQILKFYGNLLEKYPENDWNLSIIGKRARSKSVQKVLIPRMDLEYLANYDNWRKALKAKKALADESAQKETERRLEKTKTLPPQEQEEQEEQDISEEESENNALEEN